MTMPNVRKNGPDAAHALSEAAQLRPASLGLEPLMASEESDGGLKQPQADLLAQATLLDLIQDMVFVYDLEGRVIFWNASAERLLGWSKADVLGKIGYCVLQTQLPSAFSELLADLSRDECWEGELTHTTRDGRQVHVDSRWTILRNDDGSPTAILEVDSDITQLKQTEARAAEERSKLFAVLNMLPGYVALVDRRHNIRYANHGFLDAFSEPEDRPCYNIQYGLDEPCEDCPMTAEHGNAEEWEYTHPNGTAYRVRAFPFKEADGTETLLEFGIDITERKELEGLVNEVNEADRRRIGRDLHDTLGQSLTGLSYLVGGLADRLAAVMPTEKVLAEQITETINDTIAQVRALARGLDPIGVDADGLPSALRELAANIQATTELCCRFHCDCQIELEESEAAQLYHIAQEAMTNAVKHAAARSVEITLSKVNGNVVLKLADDGVGLSGNDSRSSGMGMRTMRHRADTLGATLRIRAREHGGTVVTCSLPKVDT